MSESGPTAQVFQRLTGMQNEQLVFNVLKSSGVKMNIAEIAKEVSGITERTVRRCIADLIEKGMVRKYGRTTSGVQYALADKSMYESEMSFSEEELKLISFAGTMVTVTQFLEMMVSPDQNPLASKEITPVLRRDIANGIRRAMAGVVMTAATAGQESYLANTRVNMQKFEDELSFILRLVREFNTSAVWFDQYRDRMAYQLRLMQKNNPELWQLGLDFVRSE
jgi:predicted DNA-binding transcriptional regulator